MDVQLILPMCTAAVLEGCRPRDYQREYPCILQTLGDCLEARLIDGDGWYKDRDLSRFTPLLSANHVRARSHRSMAADTQDSRWGELSLQAYTRVRIST